MFLLIAMVHVAVNLLHARPDTWGVVADNPWAVLVNAFVTDQTPCGLSASDPRQMIRPLRTMTKRLTPSLPAASRR